MKLTLLAIIGLLTFCTSIGYSQTNETMIDQGNPLLCDIVSGMCEVPSGSKNDSLAPIPQSQNNRVSIIYFTDPICSSCWGIEPQLRQLKLDYGHCIDIEYRMGGLLPNWSYNRGGISKPADVAHHWEEMSVYYDMPIDGDIWLEDPLPSSYPPSIAFKAAQMQDQDKAVLFLREIREMVFLEKKNITQWAYLEEAAKNVGLNVDQLKTDYGDQAIVLFNEDLALAKELGVRGFPTMFFVDDKGNSSVVYGSRPYSFYEVAVLQLAPNATKNVYKKSWEDLFAKFPTLTALEFSALSGIGRKDSEQLLDELTAKGLLTKLTTKNGAIWTLK